MITLEAKFFLISGDRTGVPLAAEADLETMPHLSKNSLLQKLTTGMRQPSLETARR